MRLPEIEELKCYNAQLDTAVLVKNKSKIHDGDAWELELDCLTLDAACKPLAVKLYYFFTSENVKLIDISNVFQIGNYYRVKGFIDTYNGTQDPVLLLAPQDYEQVKVNTLSYDFRNLLIHYITEDDLSFECVDAQGNTIKHQYKKEDLFPYLQNLAYAEQKKNLQNTKEIQTWIETVFEPLNLILKKDFKYVANRIKQMPSITGVPTGFNDFDKMIGGLQKANLIVLAGRPRMGKTALALDITLNAAIRHNIPVCIFSLEMSKKSIGQRLFYSAAKLDTNHRHTDIIKNSDLPKLSDAIGKLSNAHIYIDDTPGISVPEMMKKIKLLKAKQDIGLIIIDYVQLMRNVEQCDDSEQPVITISQYLKVMARRLNVPVVILSQLKRDLEGRLDKRPVISDLLAPANEIDADVVCFLYRKGVYEKTKANSMKGNAELILVKNRNGPTGTVMLNFSSKYGRFTNLSL